KNLLRARDVAGEDDLFLSEVADTQSDAGEWKAALDTAGSIKENLYFRVQSLGHIAVTQAVKGGDLKEVLRSIKAIETINNGDGDEALINTVAALIKAGRVDSAVQLAENAQEEYSKNRVLLEIATARARREEIDDAFRAANSITEDDE